MHALPELTLDQEVRQLRRPDVAASVVISEPAQGRELGGRDGSVFRTGMRPCRTGFRKSIRMTHQHDTV